MHEFYDSYNTMQQASKEDGMLVIDERGIQNTSTEQATFDTSSYEDEATNTSLNNTPNKNTITKNLFLENIGKNFFDNNFINNKNFSPSKLFNCDNNISTQPDAFTANSLNFLAGIRLLKSSPNVLPIKTTLPSAVLISPQTNINKNNNTTTSTKHNINKSRRKSDRVRYCYFQLLFYNLTYSKVGRQSPWHPLSSHYYKCYNYYCHYRC